MAIANGLVSPYEHIVRFQIGVHEVALSEQAETEKHLMGVGADGLEVDADVFSVSFYNFSKVETVILFC